MEAERFTLIQNITSPVPIFSEDGRSILLKKLDGSTQFYFGLDEYPEFQLMKLMPFFNPKNSIFFYRWLYQLKLYKDEPWKTDIFWDKWSMSGVEKDISFEELATGLNAMNYLFKK